MKFKEYIKEISPALAKELMKKHNKTMKDFFDMLWKEAGQRDKQGQKEYADGMRAVLNSYRESFL